MTADDVSTSEPTASPEPAGPLAGVRVLELAGIGPGPFAAMVLADLGAEVVRIARPRAADLPGHRWMNRSRHELVVDLGVPDGAALVRRLAADADAVLEGFRPGVAERLGVGPDDLLATNPALVVGRMTGWGQDGPWADLAGHDIGYLAVTGGLAAIGRRDGPPVPPLNLVADFGGGAMFLVAGVLAALLSARATGRGQVVDAAMVDGASVLLTMFHDLHDAGLHTLQRGTNLLDSGAWFYDTYRCADGEWIALGPIEPPFRNRLCDLLELGPEFRGTDDPRRWPALSTAIAEVVAAHPRAHWDDLLGGTDACYAPVLTLDEAPDHPHLAARGTFVSVDGDRQPAPAPRFSHTPTATPRPRRPDGADTDRLLADLGLSDDEVADLRDRGVVA